MSLDGVFFQAYFCNAQQHTYASFGFMIRFTNEEYHGVGIVDCRPLTSNPPNFGVVLRITGIYHYGLPLVVCYYAELGGYRSVPYILRHDGLLPLPWVFDDFEPITRTSSAPLPERRRVRMPPRPSTP